jgi:hypothetical protein
MSESNTLTHDYARKPATLVKLTPDGAIVVSQKAQDEMAKVKDGKFTVVERSVEKSECSVDLWFPHSLSLQTDLVRRTKSIILVVYSIRFSIVVSLLSFSVRDSYHLLRGDLPTLLQDYQLIVENYQLKSHIILPTFKCLYPHFLPTQPLSPRF